MRTVIWILTVWSLAIVWSMTATLAQAETLPIEVKLPLECELEMHRDGGWICDYSTNTGRKRRLVLDFHIQELEETEKQKLFSLDLDGLSRELTSQILEIDTYRDAEAANSEYTKTRYELLDSALRPPGFSSCAISRDEMRFSESNRRDDRASLHCWGVEHENQIVFQMLFSLVEFNDRARNASPTLGEEFDQLVASISYSPNALAADLDQGVEAINAGDCQAGINIFLALAKEGDAQAKFNLGYMYREALCVEKDDVVAFEWFLAAAVDGDTSAQDRVGWLYANGVGIGRDLLEAAYWSHQAAMQGSEHAKENLGAICFELGWAYMGGGDDGYPKDFLRSWMWFSLAEDNGFVDGNPVDSAWNILRNPITQRQARKTKQLCVDSGFKDCS